MLESLQPVRDDRHAGLADFAGRFRFNGGLFDRLVDGFAGEDWHRRPSGSRGPAETGESAYWLLGHLVVMRAGLLRLLGGRRAEPAWADLFVAAGASERWLAAGPPPDELVGEFRSLDRSVLRALTDPEALAARSDARAPTAAPLEDCVGFYHFDETFHLGQLALLRRQLGKRAVV